MAALMIVLLRNDNTDWLADYVANVPAILRSYGGEYVGISASVKKLEGVMPAPHQAAVFSFPSLTAIDDFMNCDAYAPFRDARQRASEAEIFMFESE